MSNCSSMSSPLHFKIICPSILKLSLTFPTHLHFKIISYFPSSYFPTTFFFYFIFLKFYPTHLPTIALLPTFLFSFFSFYLYSSKPPLSPHFFPPFLFFSSFLCFSSSTFFILPLLLGSSPIQCSDPIFTI